MKTAGVIGLAAVAAGVVWALGRRKAAARPSESIIYSPEGKPVAVTQAETRTTQDILKAAEQAGVVLTPEEAGSSSFVQEAAAIARAQAEAPSGSVEARLAAIDAEYYSVWISALGTSSNELNALSFTSRSGETIGRQQKLNELGQEYDTLARANGLPAKYNLTIQERAAKLGMTVEAYLRYKEGQESD